MYTNPAHGLPIYINGKYSGGMLLGGKSDEGASIFWGIGVGKRIRHELCDVGIVGMFNQVIQIMDRPRA